MTNERTQAYGRVVQTLDELGPTKLLPAEQARIRDAADTLIFACDLEEARDALRDMGALAEHLLASGRWLEERVDALVADLLGCGPETPLRSPRRSCTPRAGSAPVRGPGAARRRARRGPSSASGPARGAPSRRAVPARAGA